MGDLYVTVVPVVPVVSLVVVPLLPAAVSRFIHFHFGNA